MSLTGDAAGPPLKAGVGIADVLTGMYAAVGILAAEQARHRTGLGQHIDLALLDAETAMLANQGVAYLTDGQIPSRRGNDHPTIVPCGTCPGRDSSFILVIGNDAHFARFAANADRVRNHAVHVDLIGNPLHLSETPVHTAKAPPTLSEDTMAVLARDLGLEAGALQDLAAARVIEGKSQE